MGNGYVWYQRRNEETGLENQCWKDSWDSISYRDGRLPGFPRATCELQGYAYDAKIRGARLAREVWNDPDVRRPTREARPPISSAASTATSGSRRRVLRARARHRGQPGRLAHVEQRPPALERHRRQVQGEGRRRQPARPEAVLGLGRAHARRRRGPLQPDRLPRRHGLAVRQLVHRVGPPAVRVQGRGRDDRRGHPRRGGVLRRAPARGVRRLRALAHEVPGPVPDRLQPPGMVDRRAAPAPADDARARAGRRASGRRSRAARRSIGRLELLDIPGRWGRIDAFGRGRVDVGSHRPRGAPRRRDRDRRRRGS